MVRASLRVTWAAVLAVASTCDNAFAEACTINKVQGCFDDVAGNRVLPYNAVFSAVPTAPMSHEICAEACCAAGYADGFSGVEYGTSRLWPGRALSVVRCHCHSVVLLCAMPM